MIAGYAQNGALSEALGLFDRLREEKIQPKDVALVSVLSVCADSGSVELSEQIGRYVESQELASDTHVASVLLSMYSKCGNISKAFQIFKKIPWKDVVTWNSMIVGLAKNGLPEDAFALYKQMMETDLKPNNITFVGAFTACRCGGLVETGLKLFRSMREDYGISTEIEHYVCLVDLFCRSGRLKDAHEIVSQMEMEPNAVIWGSLFHASRIHLNVELAELSVRKLAELEPNDNWYYILLSNIYSSLDRWEEAIEVRNLVKDKKLEKEAAYIWVRVENELHKFLAADPLHPRSAEVFCILNGLAMQSLWAEHHLESGLEP
ncbi:hypothetical protein CDL15_Pgr014733 [Punica granatum]|uniref:Pentatricopeptide repeat-containing protein n=1 Tax=Punica granatum TaxID=22663 RepID=A0A218Y050_PUNGR|nr:hypothetical protein CDL15_Pgr014733 [Punica granatum]PKI78009.1 hypothetical protein CRG98_001629 [Punica granatum]